MLSASFLWHACKPHQRPRLSQCAPIFKLGPSVFWLRSKPQNLSGLIQHRATKFFS